VVSERPLPGIKVVEETLMLTVLVLMAVVAFGIGLVGVLCCAAGGRAEQQLLADLAELPQRRAA